MAYVIKRRGEDIKVQVKVYDSASLAYLPILSLANLEVYVINLTTNRILQKFTVAGGGGFRALVMDDAFTYYGWIYDTETADAKLGKYIVKTIYGIVDATLPDNSDENANVEEGFILRP